MALGAMALDAVPLKAALHDESLGKPFSLNKVCTLKDTMAFFPAVAYTEVWFGKKVKLPYIVFAEKLASLKSAESVPFVVIGLGAMAFDAMPL